MATRWGIMKFFLVISLILLIGVSAANADDVIFTEDFESGGGLWYSDNGVWQIGAPTVGPPDCHSGANCAGTVLDGNYPDNTDSHLISPPVNLPTVAGSEAIYLVYWQWFSYSESPVQDGGVVQVSYWDDGEGGWSTWMDISEKAGFSSPWSRTVIDLTAYAGERVRIGFFHYADSLTQSSGWYVDDIEILVKVPEFTGDFENGWEDWSADRGVWQIGAPTVGPPDCHSGVNCAGTVLDGNYPDNTDSRLISPPINLPATSCDDMMALRFWQWFSYSESPVQDGGVVQVSYWDDGEGGWSTWTTVSNPIGFSSPWSKSIIDLAPWAGQQIRIGFFHYADSLTQSNGWYIDDIDFPGLSPNINSITYDLYVPKGDSANISVVAADPCGGSLEYKWDALDGGTIVGDGHNVSFIMPVGDRFCPYRVRVAVISEETRIGSTSIIEIYNRCPGDGNEDGVVNILDKVLVRNAFGTQCGDANFDSRADVNCDCAVNILDKVQVRNSFGCSQ